MTLKELHDSLDLWEARERRAHINHQNSAKEGRKDREKFWIEKEREAEKLIARRRKQLEERGGHRPSIFTSASLGLKFQYIWGLKGTPKKGAQHYTAGHRCKDAAALKREMIADHAFHKSKNWGGVSYECMVADDGTIGLGNPMKRLSAGVAGQNSGLVNICCPGSTGDKMTEAQIRSVKWYIHNAHTAAIPKAYRSPVRLASISEGWRGHREYPRNPTACPGDMLSQYHVINRSL